MARLAAGSRNSRVSAYGLTPGRWSAIAVGPQSVQGLSLPEFGLLQQLVRR